MLDRVQNWLSSDSHDDDARLVVLTRGAIAVDSSEDVTDLGQAAVWGLLRSAQTENPGRILLVDVDDWASADVAVAETAGRDESQLALRDGVCFAPRLVRTERIEGAELVEAGTWRLATLGNGTLDSRNVALRPWPESKRPLEPGEVRLGLRCSGVNFRDVLIALGDPADYDVGLEGSGVVLEVADDVLGFAPGDRVMGQFFGAGPVVVVDHRRIARIPSGWSYAQAATVPAVFLTAYYALAHLARVSAGERVLVHAAHRRCWHGCGAAGQALGPRRVCDGQPRRNGKPCAAWDSTTTISRTHARSNSSRSSPRQPTGRVWTSYSIA